MVTGSKPVRRDRSSETQYKHGSVACYINHRCSCVDCRAEWATRTMKLKIARKARLDAGEANVVHGKVSTYGDWGCHCAECRAAWAKATAERTARRRARLAQTNGNGKEATKTSSPAKETSSTHA